MDYHRLSCRPYHPRHYHRRRRDPNTAVRPQCHYLFPYDEHHHCWRIQWELNGEPIIAVFFLLAVTCHVTTPRLSLLSLVIDHVYLHFPFIFLYCNYASLLVIQFHHSQAIKTQLTTLPSFTLKCEIENTKLKVRYDIASHLHFATKRTTPDVIQCKLLCH
jgi:hypothetical protein